MAAGIYMIYSYAYFILMKLYNNNSILTRIYQ